MVWHRVAGLAVAILVLAVGGTLLGADEKKAAKGHHDRADALASKLGLSEEQREKIRKIHTDFDKKEDPIEHRLHTLHHEEREALSKVLTEEQRGKVPEVMKAEMQKEWDKLASKLGLNEEQKTKARKIHEEYGSKFRALAGGKGERGEGEFRKLRHQEIEAVREVLNEDQRHKLPSLMRQEFHDWRDPATRREHLKAIADKLGLSAEQREQAKKVHESFETKIHKEAEQLRQLHKEEHEAIAAVLTEAQRKKFHELHRGEGRREKE